MILCTTWLRSQQLSRIWNMIEYLTGRLVATVMGVPASVDLCRLIPLRHRDGQTVWDLGSLLTTEEVSHFYLRKTGDHVAALFEKITPHYNSGGRRTGKYMFIRRKQRYATMKEYLTEHLHQRTSLNWTGVSW